jgi:uncharacterized protein (TIGR03435 family)
LFSIEAVTSAPASPDQMMVMLRTALADRFRLKLRQESREMPVFVLEVATGGPKFGELKPSEVRRPETAPAGIYPNSFSSVTDLANALNGVFGGILKLDRIVIDRTRLTGRYDIHFRTERETEADDFGRGVSRRPNLSCELKSELGLKLVPDRVSMPRFIVVEAEQSSPN